MMDGGATDCATHTRRRREVDIQDIYKTGPTPACPWHLDYQGGALDALRGLGPSAHGHERRRAAGAGSRSERASLHSATLMMVSRSLAGVGLRGGGRRCCFLMLFEVERCKTAAGRKAVVTTTTGLA